MARVSLEQSWWKSAPRPGGGVLFGADKPKRASTMRRRIRGFGQRLAGVWGGRGLGWTGPTIAGRLRGGAFRRATLIWKASALFPAGPEGRLAWDRSGSGVGSVMGRRSHPGCYGAVGSQAVRVRPPVLRNTEGRLRPRPRTGASGRSDLVYPVGAPMSSRQENDQTGDAYQRRPAGAGPRGSKSAGPRGVLSVAPLPVLALR